MQRQVILDALADLASHPTAEEVYLHVNQTHPTISKATVYRNLAAAADEGQIASIGVIDGAMRYDHLRHEHHHFMCNACGEVSDVPSFDLHKQAKSLKDIHVEKVELTLRGLCGACANKLQEKGDTHGK